MSDLRRAPRWTPRRAVPSVLLAAALTSACWLEECSGLDNCDPTKQDCSLSVTCCSPPVSVPPALPALTLACQRHLGIRDGDDFVEVDLNIGGGTPPYAYAATFGDGQSTSGSRAGLTGETTRVTLSHTYDRPGGLEAQTFDISATVTDQAGVRQSCAVSHPVNPPRLDLDCNVNPRNGFVPLAVTFDARPSGCIGPCSVTWDFGDGVTVQGRFAAHTYTQPGLNIFYTWPARATVTDSTDRSYECLRTVEVRPAPDPPPPPSGPPPPPSGNNPPVITGFTATPATIFSGGSPASLSAMVSDPDGDPLTWMLYLDTSSTTTGTFTPASGSGNVSAAYFAAPPTAPTGQAVIRVVVSDGRGGTAQATVTVHVILG